jgi:hypothetical protein
MRTDIISDDAALTEPRSAMSGLDRGHRAMDSTVKPWNDDKYSNIKKNVSPRFIRGVHAHGTISLLDAKPDSSGSSRETTTPIYLLRPAIALLRLRFAIDRPLDDPLVPA